MSHQALREHLLELLNGGGAHATFHQAVAGIAERLRGVVPEGFTRSAWQIVDHMRVCQEDILDYMQADHYEERNFPDDYWVSDPVPDGVSGTAA